MPAHKPTVGRRARKCESPLFKSQVHIIRIAPEKRDDLAMSDFQIPHHTSFMWELCHTHLTHVLETVQIENTDNMIAANMVAVNNSWQGTHSEVACLSAVAWSLLGYPLWCLICLELIFWCVFSLVYLLLSCLAAPFRGFGTLKSTLEDAINISFTSVLAYWKLLDSVCAIRLSPSRLVHDKELAPGLMQYSLLYRVFVYILQ